MSWPVFKLEELVKISKGKKHQLEEKVTPTRYIQIDDLRNDNLVKYTHDKVGTFVDINDVIIAWDGANAGTIGYGLNGLIGSTLARLSIVKLGVDTEYLALFLQSKAREIRDNCTGATIPHVSKPHLISMEIPLPPLTEQKRIAAILDKADAIRRKRQQAIQLADDFLRAVFLDMFGDPVTNPKGWEPATLGDLIYFAKDGPHVSPKYSEVGIPFLSTRHVKPTGIVWKDLKYITPEEADIHWKKCKPTLGDILYTKGGTTGIACAVDFEKNFAVWVHVALLRPKSDKVSYVWLTHMLNSKYCYQQSQRYTRGATNKDLGLKRMIDIEMYCPPIDEQNKFVEVKNRIDGLINKGHSFAKSDLFGSLSQKAFQGEL
ncbi:MAG: type I restriction enzyme S subunit [Oleiphilaceae bacterium]